MTKERQLAGMTVDERLFALGLLTEFDQAALMRNKDDMVEILIRARFSKSQAIETAETLLRDPEKYGF